MGVLKAQPSSLSGESSLASTADKGSHVVSSKSEDIKRKKRLVKAYQIFSDPGVENKVQPTHDDIEGAFSQLFGGGRFSSVIGTVDLETLIVDFQSGDEHSDSSSAKEIAAKRFIKREQRVADLADHLSAKLQQITACATDTEQLSFSQHWRDKCIAEAEELKEAPYGIELMQCVGSVYILRAKQHLASAKSLFGAGGWVLNAQGQYQTLGKGLTIVGTAIVVQGLSAKLMKVRRGKECPSGNPTPEEEAIMRKIQNRLRYWLLQYAKIEIERVIRETCCRVLQHGISSEEAHLRALALQVLGEAYTSVRACHKASESDEFQ